MTTTDHHGGDALCNVDQFVAETFDYVIIGGNDIYGIRLIVLESIQ